MNVENFIQRRYVNEFCLILTLLFQDFGDFTTANRINEKCLELIAQNSMLLSENHISRFNSSLDIWFVSPCVNTNEDFFSVETPDKSEILRYLIKVWKNLASILEKDKKFNAQIINQGFFSREIIGIRLHIKFFLPRLFYVRSRTRTIEFFVRSNV